MWSAFHKKEQVFNLIKLYNLRGILHVHAHVHGPRPYEVGFCHEFRLNFTLIFKSLEGEKQRQSPWILRKGNDRGFFLGRDFLRRKMGEAKPKWRIPFLPLTLAT